MSALKALDRFEEAIDCCDRCLSYDTKNDEIKSLRSQLSALHKAQVERRKRKELEEQKRRLEAQRLKVALKKRNIVAIDAEGVEAGPHQPFFDFINDPSGSSMAFPVFFLYPQHATSDTISDFNENARFYDHLTLMFPPKGLVPDWDKNREYIANNLVVFAMTRSKRLLRIGKKMTLMDVFTASSGKDGATDGLELKQGYLSFVVIPKGEHEAEWVDKYKSSR